MATSASTVLATLPITLGGSGLAELGIWAYLVNLNTVPSLQDFTTDSSLSVIVVWRIASYHVPLVIMWIALMKLTLNKDTVPIKKKTSNIDLSGSTDVSHYSENEDSDLSLGKPSDSKGKQSHLGDE